MSRKDLIEKMVESNYSVFYFCNKDDKFNAKYFKNVIVEDMKKISDTNENLIDINNIMLTSDEIKYLFKLNFKRFHETLKLLGENINY